MAEERGEEAKELYRMYRIWRTTRQMLQDRVGFSDKRFAVAVAYLAPRAMSFSRKKSKFRLTSLSDGTLTLKVGQSMVHSFIATLPDVRAPPPNLLRLLVAAACPSPRSPRKR